MPSGWPSPVTISAPKSPGGVSRPSESGLTETASRAPGGVGCLGQGRQVVDAAEEVGVLHDHQGGVLVDQRDQRLGAVGQQGRVLVAGDLQ